MFVNDS